MKIAKALVAALTAGLGSLATALADNAVSAEEWSTIALTAVVALGAVWGVPNRQAAAGK